MGRGGSDRTEEVDLMSLRCWTLTTFPMVLLLLLPACYTVEVDNAELWCVQLTEGDLYDLAPAWAVLPGVRFHGDDIRMSYAALLDEAYMEKVNDRSDRMAWVEGTTLHMESLGNLMDLEHEVFIQEWREGIRRAEAYETTDDEDRCLYGSVTSLFDQLVIHTADHDGIQWVNEEEVLIPIGTRDELRAKGLDPI